MKIALTIGWIFLSVVSVFGAKVDTIEVFSESMQKNIKTVIVQPDNQNKTSDFSTLFLLHGFGGRYDSFVNEVKNLGQLADQYGILLVCPDGGFGSWYWDVEGNKEFQYETFVSKELVTYVDEHYAVKKDAKNRGITGFSMGGHGALYLAIRHPDVFGAVASLAGGVDIRPFPDNWDMSKRLGEYASNREKWDRHTVMESLHLIKPNSLNIFISCGYGDFFYTVNEKLHAQLSYLNIPHHYHTSPGQHTWSYVSGELLYQFAFFNSQFNAD